MYVFLFQTTYSSNVTLKVFLGLKYLQSLTLRTPCIFDNDDILDLLRIQRHWFRLSLSSEEETSAIDETVRKIIASLRRDEKDWVMSKRDSIGLDMSFPKYFKSEHPVDEEFKNLVIEETEDLKVEFCKIGNPAMWRLRVSFSPSGDQKRGIIPPEGCAAINVKLPIWK